MTYTLQLYYDMMLHFTAVVWYGPARYLHLQSHWCNSSSVLTLSEADRQGFYPQSGQTKEK